MTNPADRSFYLSAVERFEAPLLAYARRILGDLEAARDVVQDTFLRLLRQPRQTVEAHLAEWLYTVCRNRAFDTCRKESRMKSSDESGLLGLASKGPTPGVLAERKETARRAAALLDELPPRQSECIRLKFGAGLSYQEISRVTSHSISYVGVLIHEGMKTLRSRLVEPERQVKRAVP